MALILTYTHDEDLVITNAYIRIKKISLEHDPELAQSLGGQKHVCRISVEVKQSKNNKWKVDWHDDKWVFAVTTGNLLDQAYNYLKSLPAFAGAVDTND